MPRRHATAVGRSGERLTISVGAGETAIIRAIAHTHAGDKAHRLSLRNFASGGFCASMTMPIRMTIAINAGSFCSFEIPLL